MHKHTSTIGTADRQNTAAHEHDTPMPNDGGLSRRHFLTSSTTGLVAAITTEMLADTALAADRKAKGGSRGGRILLKGGCVLSLDSNVGDFETADVLIEGSKIIAVQPNLTASAVEVIDASNMIVMPGFVDTHRHIWEGILRSILPNGLLSDYQRDITGAARAVYRPEDAYAGNLMADDRQHRRQRLDRLPHRDGDGTRGAPHPAGARSRHPAEPERGRRDGDP
jgi:hypothetical protein